MRVKVSICIPCYNQTEYLRKNLESVLAQNFKDYEVILTDDSDTQVVADFVRDFFANTSASYKYHKNEIALGSPANWNKALQLASGDYIKIMHHDDWFSGPDSLAQFVAALDARQEADFVFCNSQVLDVLSNTNKIHTPDQNLLGQLSQNNSLIFNNNCIGSPTATMFRAKHKLLFDEKLKYLVDVDFYIRLLNLNSHFVHIDKALIVNTSNLHTQVTASSVNKQTQLGEYSYLYNKVFKGQIPDRKMRHFFKDLFAWYGLGRIKEIEQMGYEIPRPAWLFRLLNIWSKFKL